MDYILFVLFVGVGVLFDREDVVVEVEVSIL